MADYHVDSLTKLLNEIKARPKVEEPTTVALVHDNSDGASTLIQVSDVPRTVTIKNVFRHPLANPIVLDLLLIAKYGEAWLGWESETIELRVARDFGEVSALNISKAQAMRTLHLVDSFWERWEVFVWCAMPLNSIFPDFHTMQVPSVLQCMVAADIASKVRDKMEWSDELKQYLAIVHLHDGIVAPQPPLSFVTVDASDFAVDVSKVREDWSSVRKSGHVPDTDSAEAEQLRRMLLLRTHYNEYIAQLQQQLEIVHDA
jgi:hypothetical protein